MYSNNIRKNSTIISTRGYPSVTISIIFTNNRNYRATPLDTNIRKITTNSSKRATPSANIRKDATNITTNSNNKGCLALVTSNICNIYTNSRINRESPIYLTIRENITNSNKRAPPLGSIGNIITNSNNNKALQGPVGNTNSVNIPTISKNMRKMSQNKVKRALLSSNIIDSSG